MNYSGRTEAVTVGVGIFADDGSSNDGPATARDNVHIDVENLFGGSGNDTLNGYSTANVIHDGDDTLYARDSTADTLLDGGVGTDKAQIDSTLDTNRTSIEQLLA